MPQNAAPNCTVIDQGGGVWRFERGASLCMIGPAGTRERIASYRDGIWRMGEAAGNSIASGPAPFVRAWVKGVPTVFPRLSAAAGTVRR